MTNFCLVVIATIALCTSVHELEATDAPKGASDDGVQGNDEEYEAKWTKLHYKVFDIKGLDMEPDETLEVLKELDKLYRGRKDEDTLKRRSRLIPIISVSEVKKEKCNREDFEAQDELIRFNSPFQLNIVPYLREFRRKQRRFCQEYFHEHFQEAIGKLPPNDHELIDKLMDHISKALSQRWDGTSSANYKLSLNISFDYIREGILNHLKDTDGVERLKDIVMVEKSTESMQKIREILDDEVLPLCERVVKETESFRFIEQLGLSGEADDHIKRWVRRGNICLYILKKEDGLVEDLDTTLRAEFNPKEDGKLKRMLKKLSCSSGM